MKTAEIRITGIDDWRRALLATEKTGEESGLSGKQNLRLRLLAEELIGFIKSLTGDVDAKYHATAVEEKILKEKIIWLQEMRF